MPRSGLLAILISGLLIPAHSQKPNPFSGRWDVEVSPTGSNAAIYPDWMEVAGAEGAATVRIQPRTGSAFTTNKLKIEGSHLTVTWPQGDTTWELDLTENRINGTERHSGNVFAFLAGVRAPALDRKPPAAWSDPQALFNGKDLSGWEPIGSGKKNNWTAKDGELVNQAAGANLRTSRTFNDFKLHVEFNCPNEGNSGVYLRGRYEVQIEYEAPSANDALHAMGAIYSFIAPSMNLGRKPGAWESYDITLVGRRVAVFRNRIKTINDQEIPGPTGGAIDANEGDSGPIYLQGDHTGGLRFRNMTIQVPKK